MKPDSSAKALALLKDLGAPTRLLRHVELVAEAADILLMELRRLGLTVHDEFVRVGVILHDAGKVLYSYYSRVRNTSPPGSDCFSQMV